MTVVCFRFLFTFFLVFGVFVLSFVFSHTGVVNGCSSSYKAINLAIAKTPNLRNVTIVVRRFTISKDTNLVDQGNAYEISYTQANQLIQKRSLAPKLFVCLIIFLWSIRVHTYNSWRHRNWEAMASLFCPTWSAASEIVFKII